MFHKNYLKDINKDIFKSNHKHIHEGKEGDTVIYRGGYGRKDEDLLTSRSFIEGNEYILSANCYLDSSIGIFLNIHKEPINGHISIVRDETGHSNGWGAALFELK